MPTFEIEHGGKTYEVEAPSQDAAVSALSSLDAPAPAAQTAAPTQSPGVLNTLKDYWQHPAPNGFVNLVAKPLVNAVAGGAHAFGEAASGTLDPNSDEAISRMAGLGAIVTPGAPGGLLARAASPPAVAAASRLGVPLSRAAASTGATAPAVAGALKEMPLIGTPLVKSSQNTLTALDSAATRTADSFGSGDTVAAGTAGRDAMSDWITGRSAAIADRAYQRVNSLVDPNVRAPLDATTNTVAEILARRQNGNIAGDSGAVNSVLGGVTDPQGMNYQGIKTLRSSLGEKTPQELVAQGISATEHKQLYGALSEDLRNTAHAAGGPEALAAFDHANSLYSDITARREALSKIIGRDASATPESIIDRVARMAGTTSTANATSLLMARKAMGSAAWDELASAIVKRMGRVSADSPNFSAARFATAWGKMSEDGRRILFNSTGRPDRMQALRDMNTLSGTEKRLQSLGNPSGTGRVNTLLKLGGGIAAATLHPSTVLAGIAARIAAGRLAKPVVQVSARRFIGPTPAVGIPLLQNGQNGSSNGNQP